MQRVLRCIEQIKGSRRPAGAFNTVIREGYIDKVKALTRRAETQSCCTRTFHFAPLHLRHLEVEETDLIIDLRDDMQRLVGALALLVYSNGE